MIPDFRKILEGLLPYIDDLQRNNIEDLSVGVFEDKTLRLLHDKVHGLLNTTERLLGDVN